MALPSDKKGSRYRPQFTNDLPIPAIDDFRLSTILEKHLLQQSQDVQLALCNVNAKYQYDLRQEIRNTLTIEQKIQYKNIHVAKLAHELHKRLEHGKRKLEKLNKDSPALESGLDSDVSKLLMLSASSSNAIKDLSSRLENIGGTPDKAKYPLLSKLLSEPTSSGSKRPRGNTGPSNGHSISSNGLKSATQNEPEITRPKKHNTLEQKGEDSVTSTFESSYASYMDPYHAFEHYGISKGSTSSKQLNGMLPSEPIPGSSKNLETNVISNGSDTKMQDAQDSDEEMTPEDFELLVDMNISKYRNKQNEKQTVLKGNPLRLLYSGSALNTDILKSDLYSPFVKAKSIPTVLLTPQTSHFKKLRINVLPVKYSQKICPCEDDSPSKKVPVPLRDDEELWSSSGLHTETENDTDNWTSSNEISSSDDETSTTKTNKYYMKFRKELRSKKKHKPLVSPPFTKEFLPTLKHRPSHRTLKPKLSILKIAKTGPKLTPVKLPDPLETPYHSSPRGAFVNDFAAMGFILQSKDEEALDDGILGDTDALPSVLPQPLLLDELRAVDRLKKLLI